MARIDPSFSWDAYRFLLNRIREGDKFQLLERYFQGPQAQWEAIHGDILRLLTLFDVDNVEDNYLNYMKWLVGWTSELDHITEDLTAADLRKLIPLTIPLWRQKGTPLGIESAIRLLTGRNASFLTWFHARWIVEETGLFRHGYEGDPWVVGDDYGSRDEYLSILLLMNEIGVDLDLVHNLAELNRPVGETIKIVYADLWDNFRFGRQKWKTISGDDPVWDETNARLLVPDGTRLSVNVFNVRDWDEVVFNHVLILSTAAQQWQIDFRKSPGTLDWYRITFDQAGSVTLDMSLGGTSIPLSTATLSDVLPINRRFTVGYRVTKPAAGRLRFVVTVDAEDVLEHTIGEPFYLDPGDVEVVNVGTGSAWIDNAYAVNLPVYVDEVPGDRAATPVVPVPIPFEAVNYNMTSMAGWSMTGLWHPTNFRYRSSFRSLYFGTGETGYHTWGTPGGYAGAIYTGAATSPVIDLSPWDPQKYRAWLDWYQISKVVAGPPNDNMTIEVEVSSVVVRTLTKAEIFGDGDHRIELTDEICGEAVVRFRLVFDSVISHGTTDEGWYVDDLKVLITER
jgi:hypothetical protein